MYCLTYGDLFVQGKTPQGSQRRRPCWCYFQWSIWKRRYPNDSFSIVLCHSFVFLAIHQAKGQCSKSFTLSKGDPVHAYCYGKHPIRLATGFGFRCKILFKCTSPSVWCCLFGAWFSFDRCLYRYCSIWQGTTLEGLVMTVFYMYLFVHVDILPRTFLLVSF